MKKKIIISVSIIAAVFILGIAAGALILSGNGVSVSTGRALISENGTCFLIKNNSPVRLSDYSDSENHIPDLESGDKIFVIHSGINESYPASTGVYFCKKTADGKIEDIPEEVISSLTTLGWLSENAVGTRKSISFDAKFIRTALPSPPPGEVITFPGFSVINDFSELENYRSATTNGLNEAFLNETEEYTEAFFKEYSLFIAHIEEGSGSNTHEVKEVIKSGNETCVYINTIRPEVGTCDMAYHRIIVELKKSDIENTEVQLFFNGIKKSSEKRKIKTAKDGANFSLSLPEDWNYEELTETADGSFGISIFHSSSPESTVAFEFSEFFGVCGTGLRTENLRINEYNAHMGIYDSNPTFDYIVFEDTPGYYVIKNNADLNWWKEYENDMIEIFSTLRIAEGIIFRTEAVEIAKKQNVGEYKRKAAEYDSKNGIWEITFEKDETEQVVKVDSKGNIIK